MEGSSRTDISGSGIFAGITGAFVSACGGSCEARAELLGTPEALATMEGALNPQGKVGTAIDLLSGAHNSGAQWKDSNGYIHVILNAKGTLNAGKTEMHFEGYATGTDVIDFFGHMGGTVRDKAEGWAEAEKNRVLP